MRISYRYITLALLFAVYPVFVSFALSEREITDRGLIPCLKEYCDAFDLDEIPTKEAIGRISDKKLREAKNRGMTEALTALSTLRVVAEYVKTSDMTASDRCEVLRQLARLRLKAMGTQRVGVGNMEVASLVSMLMSGIYFQVYKNIDMAKRRDILELFSARSSLFSSHAFRSALALEGRLLPKEATSEYESSAEIAIKISLPNATKDPNISMLDTLARELSSRTGDGKFERLLNELDEQWLAWDVLWGTRLPALCLLSQYLPTRQAASAEESAAPFKAFKSAVVMLSGPHRYSLNSKFPSSASQVRRIAYILLEIQRNVEDRGRHILSMVSSRLKNNP